eukprot:523853_1
MPTALCIFTLYLIIACIQTQRVTIYSWPFTSSTSGWHLDLTSSDSKLVTNTQCPGASSCYRLTNDDEFYIYVDTRTYTDIQIGYDIRSSGLDSSGDDYCEFWWMIGTATAANWEQSWIPQAQHFANDNPQSILHTSLPSDVDDYYSIGIDFWANMETSEYCYLNNVIVTGIPTAPTPTPKPTSNPTKKSTSNPSFTPTLQTTPNPTPQPAPTFNPILTPTSYPTGRPTDPDTATCGDDVIGPYNGQSVTISVHLPFEGDLQCDASASTIAVTDVEALTKIGISMATDTDHDGTVTVSSIPPGDYKFIIYGGTQTGTFEAHIRCMSREPTASVTLPPTTPNPSSNPTQRPTHAPVDSPITIHPSSMPSPGPTHRPTDTPIANPAASPTDLEIKACGDTVVGSYNGEPVTIVFSMPSTGDLQCDTRLSTLAVSNVEIFTQLGVSLATDTDHDGIVTVHTPPGYFKCVIYGDGTQTSAFFAANIECFTAEPSINPTQRPSYTPVDHPITPHPSRVPTPEPSTTQAPQVSSSDPTHAPSAWPVHVPTTRPTDAAVLTTETTRTTNIGTISYTNTDAKNKNGSMQKNDTDTALIIVLVLMSVCICVACVFFGYLGLNKWKRKETVENEIINLQNTTSPRTASNVVSEEDDLVLTWLEHVVDPPMPQYAPLFLSQGYDHMDAIHGIETREKLNELGIVIGAHVTILLMEIKESKRLAKLAGVRGKETIDVPDPDDTNALPPPSNTEPSSWAACLSQSNVLPQPGANGQAHWAEHGEDSRSRSDSELYDKPADNNMQELETKQTPKDVIDLDRLDQVRSLWD